MAGESHRHTRLAVEGAVPKAERHALIDEMVVPRDVGHERMAEQRDEIAPAAGAAQLRPQQQQVGQRVLEELLVTTATDMNLDGETHAGESAGLSQQRIEPVRHHLELHLVVPVHKREEVEEAELRMTLED